MSVRKQIAAALILLGLARSDVLADECVRERRPPTPVVGALCGVLFDPSGAVLAGADVNLTEVPAEESGRAPSGVSLPTAKVDGRGRFTFGRVPEGEYWLTVPGFKTSFDTVVVRGNYATRCTHRLRVELSVAGSCSGAVSSGAGIVLGVEAATPVRVIVDGEQDSVGYYDAEPRLLELRPGTRRIEIQAEGYAPYVIEANIRDYEARRRIVKLKRLPQ
jgi:carboxypeptidase family protein